MSTRRLTMRRRLGEAEKQPPDSRTVTGFWVRVQRLDDRALFWYEGGWYRWNDWEYDPDPIGHTKDLLVESMDPDTAVFVISLSHVDTTYPDKPQAGAVVMQKVRKHTPHTQDTLVQWRDLDIGDCFFIPGHAKSEHNKYVKISRQTAENDAGIMWYEEDSDRKLLYAGTMVL